MAEEAVDKMLEDTPVEEAAGATITSDDDMELSDNDMKRLMNMNLDDLIEDVKSDTDSISIDDLLNPDEELKNAEAKAQAQALEEAQTEKGKTDLKENKETVKVDESKIKPEKPKKDNFFKKIKKVFLIVLRMRVLMMIIQIMAMMEIFHNRKRLQISRKLVMENLRMRMNR